MTTFSLPVREGSAPKLVAIVLAASFAVAAANFYLFSQSNSWVRDQHRATDGWINPNLVIFLPMSDLIIGGLVMIWDRQGLRDLGFSPGWAGRLLLCLGTGWIAITDS